MCFGIVRSSFVARKACGRVILPILAVLLLAAPAWAQPVVSPIQHYGTYSIGEVQAQLFASGGDGTFTWEVVSGSLPPGVSLRRDGPGWFDPASSGLIGVATTPGTYTFTLRVTSNGLSVDQAATLTITALTITDYWDLPSGFVGEPYAGHTFTAANEGGPVTWAVSSWGPLPPGLSLSATGELSGTPTTAGFHWVNIIINDGIHEVTKGYNMAVYDVAIPTPSLLPAATVGQLYTTTIAASGGTPPYQFSSNYLPTGLALASNGVISGVPTQSTGRWTFSVSAVDSLGISYDKTFAVQVLAQPVSLPSVSQFGNSIDDCTLGVPCSRWIGTGGGNSPLPYTFTATGLPPGMEIRWSGSVPRWLAPGDAVLIGTPLALGTYNVQVTVTDANLAQATTTVQLRVSRLYLQPYPNGGTFEMPYSERLRIIGGVMPYSGSLFGGTLPEGVTLDGSTLLMTGIPFENGSFRPDFSVVDTAGNPYRIRPGLFFGSGSSTIQITSWYDLGTWRTGSISTQLMACCLPAYQWSAIGPMPPGLTLSSSGFLSGTASSGTFSFLAKVEDPTNALNYAVRKFVINVSPVQISSITPTTGYTLPYGNVGIPYTPVTLTATGAPPPFTWSVQAGYALPPGLTLSSDGIVSGTPTHTGLCSFYVRATDSVGNSSQAYMTVSIYPPGVTPPVNLLFSSVLTSQLKGTFYLPTNPTGGTEPYTLSWSPGATPIAGLRLLSGPPWPPAVFQPAKGALVGVLTSSGTFTSSIRATDSLGQSIDRPITIDVPSLELPFSTGDLPRATVGVPYTFMLTAIGGSGSYDWSATSLPPGFTLMPSGQLSGTPQSAGFLSAGVTLTDSVTAQTRSLFLSIQVNPFAIVSANELPTATVGTFYSYQFTAPDCVVSCSWTVSGSTPSGMSLSSAGLLSGVPTSSGTFTLSVRTGPTATPAVKFVNLFVNPSTPSTLSISNTSFSDITVGSLSTTSLFAFGGTRPYTWSVVAGSLPPGIELRTNVHEILGSGAPSLTYIFGRATTVGSGSFTLQVADNAGATATRAFTYNVSALNIEYRFYPQSGTPLVYNQPYTQASIGIGGTSSYTWTAETPLPVGLSIDPNTGTISGTPLNTGFSSTTMRLDDNAGNTMRVSVSFNVGSGTAQAINFNDGPNLGTTPRGSLYSRNLSFSGGTPPYSLTVLSPLPPGMALLTGNAVTSGTIGSTYQLVGAPLQSGTYSFTVRAQDSSAPTANVGVRTFTLAVSGTSILNFSSLFDGSVGVPYSQVLLAANDNLPTTWAALSGLPPGLTLSPAGVLAGTPSQAGTFSILVAAIDAAGAQTTRSFSLRIATIGIAGSDILPMATTGALYTHAFALAGGGAATWTTQGAGPPSGLTLSSAGVLSGTPTNFGMFQLTIQATAGAAVVTKRVSIYVKLPNPTLLTFPMAATQLSDRWTGEAFTFNFGGSNGIPPYTWTVADGSALPPGLSLQSGSTAALIAGPGNTILTGAVSVPGFYSFDLIATDAAGQTMRRTFTMTVSPIALVSASLRPVTVGAPYSQQLTAVGGTPPYTFSMEPTSPTQDMLPVGLSFSSGGLISGTTTESGNYSFRVVIEDAAGNLYRRNLSLSTNLLNGLRINDSNPPHTWVGAGFSRNLSITAPGAVTWSVHAGALPAGVSLAPSTSQPGVTVMTGRPLAAGVFTYTLRATDAAAPANFTDHSFTMTVLPMQVVSPRRVNNVFDLPIARVGMPYATTIKLAGGIPPYTFAPSPFVPLPPGLTLSAGGVLSGTPQVGGELSVQLVVSDSAGHVGLLPALILTIVPVGYEAPLRLPGPISFFNRSVGDFTRVPLDFLRGGAPPLTWGLTPGSALPDGFSILAGSNGVPDYLSGIPSVVGQHQFSLTAQDSTGQSIDVPITFEVSHIRLSPISAHSGVVGAPYSLTFLASGGVAPYAYSLAASGGLPPGLVLAGNVLTGNPLHAGSFTMSLVVTDAEANTLNRSFSINIDDSAGQAPALALSPPVIELTYVQGTPDPGPIPVAVSLSSGVSTFSTAVMGMAGSTVSVSNGTTPSAIGLDLEVSALSVGVHTGVLGVVAPDSVNQILSAPIIVTVMEPPPCTYSVLPTSGSAPAAGGSGSFGVSAPAHCGWAAESFSPSWLTITGGGSGMGAGTVSYAVAANGGPSQRNGIVDINGATYTVTQFGSACAFAITPNQIVATAAGGMATIGITASSPACGWTATGLGASPASGTGSGSVTISVPPNFTVAPVTLTATIAGQLLTVQQASVACTASLTTSTASALAAGGSGTVSIATPPGCAYTTTGVPSWLTVTGGGSGTGDGIVSYSVQANSTIAPRITTIFIGGEPFTLTQAGVACSITIDASGLGSPFAVGGGTGTIEVIANSPSCGWTTSDDASWVNLAPVTSAGSGAVSVSVQSNAASSVSRTAHITIGGQTVSLTQSGTVCAPALQSAVGSAPGGGGSGTVGVLAPAACSWNATSNAGWLSVNSFGGQGTSDVSFTAQANPDPAPRVGTLTVAGQAFTVTQAAAPCSMTLGTPGITVASGGATGTFTVTGSSAACTPAAMSFANWISVDTDYAGTAGTMTYTVTPNPQSVTRRGSIQVGDRTFVIDQLGAACAFSLNAYGALFDRHGGGSLFLGSPSALGCSPLVGVDLPAIVTLGPLSGPVLNIFTQPYTVSPFDTPLTAAIRRARITFGGQIFIVKQTSW